jgi:hypothetical protein
MLTFEFLGRGWKGKRKSFRTLEFCMNWLSVSYHSHPPRPALGSIQLPIQWVKAFIPGSKVAGG